MRTLEEIKKDINATQGQIDLLRAKLNNLFEERGDRKFADFCEKYGVRKGDIVETATYGKAMIVGFDGKYFDWVLVRKIKKDGEPYAITTSFSARQFEGCKIIGHKDI